MTFLRRFFLSLSILVMHLKSEKYSPKYVHGPKMAHYCVKSDSIIADRSRMISTVLNQFSILDFQYRLD